MVILRERAFLDICFSCPESTQHPEKNKMCSNMSIFWQVDRKEIKLLKNQRNVQFHWPEFWNAIAKSFFYITRKWLGEPFFSLGPTTENNSAGLHLYSHRLHSQSTDHRVLNHLHEQVSHKTANIIFQLSICVKCANAVSGSFPDLVESIVRTQPQGWNVYKVDLIGSREKSDKCRDTWR